MTASMKALCIDTITSAAGITLLSPQHSIHSPLNPQMASEGIIPVIDQTLKKADLKPKDLQGVLVIQGPGSFTGLRVGISVANQFAHQLQIPILGLRTDEWWQWRSEEGDKIYIQSMNKAEIYVSDGRGAKILPLEALSEWKPKKWLGELKFEHREKLPPSFIEITTLKSIEETWTKVIEVSQNQLNTQTTYDLVEPFYGKEPNITKPKN